MYSDVESDEETAKDGHTEQELVHKVFGTVSDTVGAGIDNQTEYIDEDS